MKITLTRVLALFTLFGFFATNCSCDEEGCPGSYTSWVKSDPEAIILLYPSRYADDFVFYFSPEDANAPKEIHELQPNRDNDSIGIDMSGGRGTEVRLLNGWSDIMSAESAIVDVSSSLEELSCPEQDDDDDLVYIQETNYDSVDVSKCTTPPTFAHLVLTDIRDITPGTTSFPGLTNATYSIKGRSWDITGLTDDQGQDLSMDPDWECFFDNSYHFTKDGRSIYSPGSKICDQEEEDWFDRYQALFFRFSVTAENPQNHSNPGQIKIILHAEGYVDGITDVVFNVTTSSFTEITGTVEYEGRTANFVANPQ
ncbi:MAG: hypothetical protein HWE14_14370 [Flavobacteriia bacterium]|nr:hypothetical protein [Flavobacteriia bacterium]